jgi:cell division protein FtsA
MLPAGVVMTGGLASTRGVKELAEEVMHLGVRVALPDFIGVDSPIFTGAVGTVVYAVKHKAVEAVVAATKPTMSGGLAQRLRTWWDEFLE